MAFPTTRLPVTVEMAFGATGTPLGWTWTDVTSRMESQTLTVRQGRPDEGGALQPASVSIELQNNDGALMPGNPASPYWPNVVRGTPLRVSVDGAVPALLLDGAGWASTPDNAAFDVTDLDLRIRCQPDAWANGVTWTGGARTFTNVQYLITRWISAGNQRSFALSVAGAGWPSVAWSSDGTLAVGGSRWFSELVAAQQPIWLGLTVDTNDGSGHHVVSSWVSTATTPPADITTWDLLETATITGTTSVFGGGADVQLGAITSSPSFRGRIFAAEIRSTINGTVVANPDFTTATPGATTVTDSTGKVWTLQGTAKISTRRPRFVGTVDEITPVWPFGDHNASGTQPSEARVEITASDLVRRLGQGAKPLRSSLYRHITSSRYAASITAYWPCEDDSGAVQLAAGKANVGPITLTGKVSAGSDASLPASASLPSVQANETVRFAASIPAGGSTTKWTVEWLHKIQTMATDPTFTPMLTILATGTGRQWRVSINGTVLLTEVFNNDGALIKSNATGTANLSGEWVLWRLDAAESGGTVTWTIASVVLSTGGNGSVTDSHSGTLGAVTGLDTSTTAPADGMSFGHIIVHDGSLALGWLAGADTAWVGESAAHRIWRLCTEEGVPVEVIGETSCFSTLRGDLARSEPMGPQGRATLLSLLAQAAGVDLGAIGARTTAPGFMYRARKTIENQTPALELDAARNHITRPLQPRLDDQRLRNDVAVASTGGSSARVTEAASVALEGLYAEQVDINGVGGVPIQTDIALAVDGLAAAVESQNLQQAGWRVSVGTWPGMRYPTVSIDLGVAPDLIAPFHDLRVGDLVTLTGLPDQHPTGTIELLVEGITERLTPTTWLVTLTCSPGGPWQLGALDDLATLRPTFGWWAIDRNGAMIRPNGEQFRSAGMNGGVGLALGQLGQTIASGRRGLWAMDRYPAYRLETGSVHDTPTTQWLPGGHINSGVYFDQGANNGAGDFVTIGSRVPWYRTRWNMDLYRVPCWLRSTTNITWEGITPAAADVIAGYVAECRKLVDEGLVVSPEHHGFSATNPTLPAALVANPSLSATDAAITGHTFTIVESTYMPTGTDLSQSLQFYDALAAEFAGGDENIWIGLPNEAWTTGYSTAYRDWVAVYVRRLRAAGFQGIITFPLPRWSQDLAAYAAGTIDALYDHLNTFGVAFNLVAELHCYGRDWTGGSSTLYTYQNLRTHLEACRNAGATGWPRPLWISEVGEAYPAGTSTTGDDAADRRAVELLLTDLHGPALAGEYPDTCTTGWAFADGVFDSSYAVSTGYLNKGNAEAGPDPNTDGVTNPANPFPGTYPWWDLDPATIDGQGWLTRFGAGMAEIANRIRPRDTARLAAPTTATLASTVTTSGTTLPLTTAPFSTSAADYPFVVEVNGEQMWVGGVTGTTTQTLTPVERALNTPAKTHASGSKVQVVDPLRLALGTANQAAGTVPTVTAPSSAGSFRSQLTLATAGQPPHVLTKLGYSGTTKITRAQLDGILDTWCNAHGGTIRNVTSSATWTTALAAAVPGDLIRVTTSFTGDITARGSKYSLGGANMTTSPAGGTEALPIILTCANGVSVTGSSTSSNIGTLDLFNTTHVWCVGFNTIGGQFGIRAMNWGGTSAAPAYRAYCSVTGTGHSAMAAQGWFQLIATSGGTPPAGTGNEWGFSEWFVDEENYCANVGLIADAFGETYYYGRGSAPGWVSYCKDFWHRGNEGYQFRADGLDLKPGCHRYRVLDNRYHGGYCVSGSPMTINYCSSDLDARPGWMPADVEGYLEGNRVWDINLSLTNGSSANIGAYCGLSGQRWANNLFWGIPQTGFTAGIYIRNEKGTDDTTAVATFGTAPTWFVNNLYWGTTGAVVKGGYGVGVGFPDPYPVSVVFTERNNVADNLTGAQAQADSTDFIATVPAVGAVGDAANGTAGPGSAFQLKSTSALLDTGVSIADLDLYIEADLFQQSIPATGINPGPYQ